MRRILQGNKVIYVERHRFWSIAYLTSSFIALFCAFVFMQQKERNPTLVMTVGALILAGLAFRYLWHTRAFVIDRIQDHIEIFERRFLRRGTRIILPLKALEVSLETRRTHHTQPRRSGYGGPRITWVATTHRIQITVKGSDPIEVSSELQGPGGELLAKALAQDMDRPLRTKTDDW